jgi:RHS repeat-associated protein
MTFNSESGDCAHVRFVVTYAPPAYGNGLALAVGYDQDYQPSTRIVSGNATVQSLAYGFDAAGDLKTVNDNVSAGRNQAFNYDALYRLTQASGTYGSYTYGYDADGNRSSIALTGGSNNFSASYAYAANSNQLQTVTSGNNVRSLTYTADGNTLQDNLGTGAVFGYGYNNDNRLIQSSLGGVSQASYTLNYLGQRVIKAAVQTGTTHFHYDRAGHLIAESDGSGNVVDEYVYLDDTPLAFVTPTSIDFIHADHLGTPQKMTDANQNLVWDGGASDPFMMSALPTTPNMNLRLPGQYYDSETAHHYNDFRDYDPSLGRYVESDPIGLRGGINTYAYVQANPMDRSDQLGLWVIQIGVNISGTFGLAASSEIGFAFDGHGNFGLYSTATGGVGTAADTGATVAVTDSPTMDNIQQLNGNGEYASASAGDGAQISVNYSIGSDGNASYGFSFGAGLGASTSFGGTDAFSRGSIVVTTCYQTHSCSTSAAGRQGDYNEKNKTSDRDMLAAQRRVTRSHLRSNNAVSAWYPSKLAL